jgi:hypothetical protein
VLVSSRVPPLLRGLIDDAGAAAQGPTALAEIVTAHLRHRSAWYGDLVGCLLLPADEVTSLPVHPDGAAPVEIGLVGNRAALRRALRAATGPALAGPALAGIVVRQVESAVAKRGEDPMPGLLDFVQLTRESGLTGYAEIPLTWGLMSALDALAEARAGGVPVGAKFRTGGLAAELFPTPVELAAVICACRDRALPFKLTTGLQWAIRHTDPETGLVHHGFLNVLSAATAAADGGEPADLAEILASVDPLPVIEATRARLQSQRPLWSGFGSWNVNDPIADLATLAILREPAAPA